MKNQKTLYSILTILIDVISFAGIYFVFPRLPPQVPLWFSLSWGEGQLAPKSFLFLLPVSSLFILIFNLWFSWFAKFNKENENDHREDFLNRSFIFAAFFISLINLITLVKIAGLFL